MGKPKGRVGVRLRSLVMLILLAAALALVAPASASASVQDQSYSLRFSHSSLTLHAHDVASTVVSFEADGALYGRPVDLSVSGLPAGVTALFSPSRTVIGGSSVLTLVSSGAAQQGAVTTTVTAMTLAVKFGNDPIGTTAPLGITIVG
jgi:hypothetical protein